MNYYLPSGYVDMAKIIEQPYPFIFLIHGRGTGKTYGACKYVLDKGEKFVYLRRTQTEADLCSSAEFSPFKPLMDDDPELHIVSDKIAHFFVKGKSCLRKLFPEECFMNTAPVGKA